jgi:hypothetical protein
VDLATERMTGIAWESVRDLPRGEAGSAIDMPLALAELWEQFQAEHAVEIRQAEVESYLTVSG